MKILALDIGTRRTGVAYADTDMGIPLPLETIKHTTIDGLLEQLAPIIKDRKVELLLVGMPLLLSGDEGSQAVFVKDAVVKLQNAGYTVKTMDERYTTPRFVSQESNQRAPSDLDPDAGAACQFLLLYLQQIGI